MFVTPINNSQNFQARIKINKSNLKNIMENSLAGTVVAGSGATAVGSIAAQADFDAALSQSSVPSTAYKGSTLPFINELNNGRDELGESMGVTLSVPLSVQGSGYSGFKTLDVMSGEKSSETIDNLNSAESKQVVSLNAASSLITGINMSEPMGADNFATLATTAVPLSSLDTTAVVEAYEKSKSNNKTIPS